MPVGHEDVLNPVTDKTAKQTADQLHALALQGSKAFGGNE